MQELKLRKRAAKTARVKMDFMRQALRIVCNGAEPGHIARKEKNTGIVVFCRLSSSDMTA